MADKEHCKVKSGSDIENVLTNLWDKLYVFVTQNNENAGETSKREKVY